MIDQYDEVKILLLALKYSKNGALDDQDTTNYEAFVNELEQLKIITHEQAWDFFDSLGEKNIIEYDFWRGIMIITITQNTYQHLINLITHLKIEKLILDKRIDEILTFNPHTLSKEIQETQNKIQEIRHQIENNDLLRGLENPLNHVGYYFNSVSKISNNYDDIYKNIVKPIQTEGREGIKATVKWAIISIVISTLLSFIIGNIDEIIKLLPSF